MSNIPTRPEWLKTIEPDPELQVDTWKHRHWETARRQAAIRRAWLTWLVTNYEVESMAQVINAVERRFGAAPLQATISNDMRDTGIAKVPMPGTDRSRYRLLSTVAGVNVEEELTERMRIDALRTNVHEGRCVAFIETNRGTATAIAQLVKLAVDDGVMRGLDAITTDGDSFVVIHLNTPMHARQWGTWLSRKVV